MRSKLAFVGREANAGPRRFACALVVLATSACTLPATVWLPLPALEDGASTAVLLVGRTNDVLGYSWALDGEAVLEPPFAVEGDADVVLVQLRERPDALGITPGRVAHPGVGAPLPAAMAIHRARIDGDHVGDWAVESSYPPIATDLRIPRLVVDPCGPLEFTTVRLPVTTAPLFIIPSDDGRAVLSGVESGEVFSSTPDGPTRVTVDPAVTIFDMYRDQGGQLWAATASAVWRARLSGTRLELDAEIDTGGHHLFSVGVEDDGARIVGMTAAELVERREGVWRTLHTFDDFSPTSGLARGADGVWYAVLDRNPELLRVSPLGETTIEPSPTGSVPRSVTTLTGNRLVVGDNDGKIYENVASEWVSFADLGDTVSVLSAVSFGTGVLVGMRNGFLVPWAESAPRCQGQPTIATTADLTRAVSVETGVAFMPHYDWDVDEGDVPVVFVSNP